MNVFVYWLGGNPEHGQRAKEWVKRMERPMGREEEYCTSSLTLYEAAVILAGLTGADLRDAELAEGVISSISSLPGLRVESLTARDFREALRLMEIGYALEDAIHAASALRVGAEEVVSNDRDFDRGPLRRVF